MRGVYYRADLADIAGRDQATGNRMLAFADAGGLGNLIGEQRGAGNQCRLDLLLALGVGAHAGDMSAGADLIRLQNGVER